MFAAMPLKISLQELFISYWLIYLMKNPNICYWPSTMVIILAVPITDLLTMILEEVPQKVVALSLDKNKQKNTLYCAVGICKSL